MYWDRLDEDAGRLGNHGVALNVRTIADLNHQILRQLSTFDEFDCVVGVPRSGLLVASILALQLNAPFIHLHDFLGGNMQQTYTRRQGMRHSRLLASGPDSANIKVLIVDDATSNGVTFSDIRARMRDLGLDQRYDIRYMAAYCTPGGKVHVDHFLEEVDLPRVFEWNLMHHANARFYCVDLDGVLCDDPTMDENDDGARYEHFCLNARPKIIPTAPLGAIVTARLERYRPQTEAWLRKHGVNYERLVMCNLPSGAERRRLHAHAVMKADVYATLGGMLFVESDAGQAREIYRRTGRPVFCFGEGLMGADIEASGPQIDGLLREVQARDLTIESLMRSTSWRITAPLRSLVSLVKRR